MLTVYICISDTTCQSEAHEASLSGCCDTAAHLQKVLDLAQAARLHLGWRSSSYHGRSCAGLHLPPEAWHSTHLCQQGSLGLHQLGCQQGPTQGLDRCRRCCRQQRIYASLVAGVTCRRPHACQQTASPGCCSSLTRQAGRAQVGLTPIAMFTWEQFIARQGCLPGSSSLLKDGMAGGFMTDPSALSSTRSEEGASPGRPSPYSARTASTQRLLDNGTCMYLPQALVAEAGRHQHQWERSCRHTSMLCRGAAGVSYTASRPFALMADAQTHAATIWAPPGQNLLLTKSPAMSLPA